MNEESLEKCTICCCTIEENLVRIIEGPEGSPGCLHAYHFDCLINYIKSGVNHIEVFGFIIFKCPCCSRPFTHFQLVKHDTVLSEYPPVPPVKPVYEHLFNFMANKQDFGENDPRLANTQDVERDFAIKLRYKPTEATSLPTERGHEGNAYVESEEDAEALALNWRELNTAILERRMQQNEEYEEGEEYKEGEEYEEGTHGSLTDNEPLMMIIILIIYLYLMSYLISRMDIDWTRRIHLFPMLNFP